MWRPAPRAGPRPFRLDAQGDSSDWATRAVIVPAVFQEWAGSVVPAWLLADGHTVYRYQRLSSSTPCYCANAGFEAGVYLSFIAAHYERLPAAVVFVQADWFDRRKGDGLKAPISGKCAAWL